MRSKIMLQLKLIKKQKPFLRNVWEKKQASLEHKDKKVTLTKLISLLDEFIPQLELSIRNESFVTNSKKDKNDATKKKSNFNQSLNFYNSDRTNNEPKHFKCWYHKNDHHYFNQCKELWKLDGRNVTELAKKNGICTYCGKPWKSHKNFPNKNSSPNLSEPTKKLPHLTMMKLNS